jgi:hypothetical protein
VDALNKHWERARVDARVEQNALSVTLSNVAAFTIAIPGQSQQFGSRTPVVAKIDGNEFRLLAGAEGDLYAAFHRRGTKWEEYGQFGEPPAELADRKRHGLQGPVDDAFLDAFICVKPTGHPRNDKVGTWTRSELEHATDQWRKIFRGEPPVVDDVAITDEDIRKYNLILFGDPSSNAILKRIAEKLPIRWDAQGITLGGKSYAADHHALIMIYPNPLNPAKYVVLNSGFTFREADHKTNSRQIAKLPDYAVVDLNTPPDDKAPGAIPDAGFFDESWQLPR